MAGKKGVREEQVRGKGGERLKEAECGRGLRPEGSDMRVLLLLRLQDSAVD